MLYRKTFINSLKKGLKKDKISELENLLERMGICSALLSEKYIKNLREELIGLEIALGYIIFDEKNYKQNRGLRGKSPTYIILDDQPIEKK